MPRDVITLLDDIISAIEEIETFLKDVNDLSAYQSDTLRKRAVERNLEVIGEVV
jgi:uncharacterized protein with HEPN domain